MTSGARTGLYGKHPAFGDFLQAGLSRETTEALGRWLDPTLAAIRRETGADWKAFWQDGQALRFWAGKAVFGKTVAGILRPSRDRVSRDYPLILAVEGAAVPLPGHDGTTDQHLWARMESHLNMTRPGAGAASLIAGFDPGVPPEDRTAAPAALSAHHPEGDLDALLRAAGRADADHATLSRTYWWAPPGPDRLPLWLACQGLPAEGSLRWLIGGIRRTGDPHGS